MVALPVLLLIPFLAFAASLVLAGLSQTSTAQHGSGESHSFAWYFVHGNAGALALDLFTRAIRYVVSHFAAANLRSLAKWFTGMATLSGSWFGVSALFAEEITAAVERVAHLGDAHARHRAAGADATAKAALRSANHANVHARSVGHALNHYKAHTNPQLKALHKSVAVTLPQDIGRVGGEVGALQREWGSLWKRTKLLEDGAVSTWDWIRAHPVGVAAGAFAGAVSIALSRLGLGSIRCPSLKNVYNKRGCGMWNGLDSLLGLFEAAFVVSAVCDVVPLLETAVSDLAVPVVETLTVAGAGLCRGSNGPPGALSGPSIGTIPYYLG